MIEETRKEHEERWQREWEAHVADCKARGLDYGNFLNWSFAKKLKERGPEYVALIMRRVKDDIEKEKKAKEGKGI